MTADIIQFIPRHGYSLEDARSLRAKLESDEAKRPDGIIAVTDAEMRCLRDQTFTAPPCDCA